MSEVKTPWKDYMGDVPMHLDYFQGSMFEAVERMAELYPNNIAFDFMGKSTTYKKMVQEIEKCAKSLKTLGVRPGDKVTIAMPNCPQAIQMFYAVNLIGGICNMIHPLSAEKEIEFYLNESESVTAITLDQFYNKFENIRQNTKVVNIVIASIKDELSKPVKVGYMLTEGRKIKKIPEDAPVIRWKEFLHMGKHCFYNYKVKRTGKDPAVILYSGGTTGTTKGILLSNRNFNALGNKKSGRTLQGSVHAKQRGENAYRRPGRTVAYIGAEFWDSVKRTHFVIAVRVESEGPMQELHPGDQTWYISEDGCTLEQLPFIDPRTGAPSSKENFKPAVGRLSYTRSPGEARDRICRALGIGRAASPLGKKFNEVFQMGTSMDEIPNFREFLYQYILPQPELDLEALQGDRVELENLHAVLAEAQTRAAALEQIVDYGREAAQKETEALVNRGTALLARAEEAAAGTNTWQEHLAAGKRQHEEPVSYTHLTLPTT